MACSVLRPPPFFPHIVRYKRNDKWVRKQEYWQAIQRGFAAKILPKTMEYRDISA
jgi:hypothetical protein